MFAAGAAIAASSASAEPLAIKVGESWIFALQGEEPVRARRVAAGAKPAQGEIKATVTAMAGTTMILTNNSPVSYTFIAQLVGAPPSAASKKTCTLPPVRPTIEYWPVRSAAVRIGKFKRSDDGGNCPD